MMQEFFFWFFFFSGYRNANSKRYLHSHIHCNIIHNNQDMGKT